MCIYYENGLLSNGLKLIIGVIITAVTELSMLRAEDVGTWQ